ncbi:34482_t:CDS:2 [Gigaspora margarita]|uniref:34482_t:CDS:1 n=1 Tax=Gigaspora margarita TaxID=4874 RepID=A0ABN7VEF1_GIGMA|nr:34482_t:CDS:2 [Gigaspora margarita]
MPNTKEKKVINKSCTRLTAIQKKQIHDKKKSNPNLQDDEIAEEFNCDRSTISKILKQKKWSELTLTGDIIRQKALYFVTLLGVLENEFKASEGWLSRFKARAGLRSYRIHGEAKSAPIEFLPQFQEELKNLLKFLRNLQAIFQIQERNILLLVDNATSHNLNNFDDYSNIRNCWQHTRILPFQHLIKIFPEMETITDEDYETQDTQVPEIVTAQCEAQNIIDLTDNTQLQQLTQEYLDNDEPIETEEAMDDNRIVELVKNPDIGDDKPEDPVDEEPRITFAEAKQSLNQLLKFTRQHSLQPDSFIKKSDENFFYDFLSRAHRAAAKVAKQSTLEHLIIRE